MQGRLVLLLVSQPIPMLMIEIPNVVCRECQMKNWKEHKPYCTEPNQTSALKDIGSICAEDQKIQATQKVQGKTSTQIDESQFEEVVTPVVYTSCYACHTSGDSKTLKCCSRCKVTWYCSS